MKSLSPFVTALPGIALVLGGGAGLLIGALTQGNLALFLAAGAGIGLLIGAVAALMKKSLQK